MESSPISRGRRTGRPTLRERLSWPALKEAETPISQDRATMARTYSYLFVLGGSLGLVTLLLPHAEGRSALGIGIAAALAYAAALTFMLGFDRIPMRAFRLSPIVGAVLVTVVLEFGGAAAVGAYAMFFFWVALSACYFFGLRVALAHVFFCSACYGAVLLVLHPDAPLPALYWVMGAGTLLVAGSLMAGLRSQVERLVGRLTHAAGRDPLTGLSNRREFEDRFGRELDRATRTGRPLGLAVLDLDWFKEVNDLLGHIAGDRALRELAGVLTRKTRSIDTVARLGGEEFGVLAPGAGAKETFELAERLRREVKESFADHAKPMTISCGVACFPEAGGTASELIRSADRALYAAKDLGRDRSVVYRPGETDRPLPDGAARDREGSSRLRSLVALAEALDRRRGSPEHSRLVARYAEVIARELELDEPAVERTMLAALMHDIGTVGLSEKMLASPGPLSEADIAEIRKHPEVGARILAGADLAGIGELIAAHHERPDGCGYPLGLRGDEIPVEAQIIAVADAYAAMTAKRSYRPSVSPGAALAELRDHAGTQFAVEVVEAFAALHGGLREEPPANLGQAEESLADVAPESVRPSSTK